MQLYNTVVKLSPLLGCMLMCAQLAHADIVRYQGSDGRVYFSNASPPPVLPRPAAAVPIPSRAASKRSAIVPLVSQLARRYGVDARLVQAIITVESDFNPRAVSHAGAQGLMQLMPETAARFQVDDPFDPRANIEGGVRYLKHLFQRFPGDVQRVLAAYNAGEGAVERYGGIPPYRETQHYVARVMSLYGAPTQQQQKIYRYHTASGSILFTDTPRE